jgi:hypothetical protein
MTSRNPFATLTADLLARRPSPAPAFERGVEALAPATFAEARPVSVSWRPIDLAPRGLTKRQAAAYVGVSTATFAKLVRAGVFGRPMVLDNRKRWDRVALDRTFDSLSRLPS